MNCRGAQGLSDTIRMSFFWHILRRYRSFFTNQLNLLTVFAYSSWLITFHLSRFRKHFCRVKCKEIQELLDPDLLSKFYLIREKIKSFKLYLLDVMIVTYSFEKLITFSSSKIKICFHWEIFRRPQECPQSKRTITSKRFLRRYGRCSSTDTLD